MKDGEWWSMVSLWLSNGNEDGDGKGKDGKGTDSLTRPMIKRGKGGQRYEGIAKKVRYWREFVFKGRKT